MSRGIDGLTIEELRSSRAYWWDDRFTRALLELIPTATRTLVEIGCGLGRAAHELLPVRSRLTYLGVDLDSRRLAMATRELVATDHGPRCHVIRAAGERLPMVDGIADVVLTAMTLQHIADVGAVLHEARRILGPGGIIVAAEPDHLAHRWYFDGLLEPITSAFTALTERLRAAKLPADLAIGPRVASLFRDAGFRDIDSRVHCLQAGGCRTAGEVAAELLEHADTLAATAAVPCNDSVQACRSAVECWLSEVGPRVKGQYAWFVPVFVTSGRR